jgi:hypothetical protein
LAAIVALFTVSIFYRGLESKAADGSSTVRMPVGGEALAKRTILSQSRELELRELEEGDPEIAGEAVRLSLVGSRGLAVTALWYAAIEKQKRNDFHEFEQLVKAVTTLQPHFITPWIFQSWNIAYNVSVEMQSLSDMYHYIARGIDLLAEGERRNRRSPDMRYEIGTYYQTKFGIADQVQTLRCLFQLSCMPPDARNPEALENPDHTVNMEAFKKFCQDHPSLVRRLRGDERQDREKEIKTVSESLRTRRPEDVVQFLRENRNVPSRYKNATELKPAEQQFPALPPKFPEGEGEAHPRASADDLGESFSGYLAARGWFHYANVLAPPNPRDNENNPIPFGSPEQYDQFKYRIPRRPVLILFRQGAPRAQTYQAEMMQKDGWFDSEGWDVDARSEDNPWFFETVGGVKRRPKEPFKVGAGLPWSAKEWQASFRMWSDHGYQYGLELSPSRLSRLKSEAGVANENDYIPLPPRATTEQLADPAFATRYQAAEALSYYQSNRQLTNFPFYLANSRGEQLPETIEARKTLWKADQARRLGNNVVAAGLYKTGLLQWQKVLGANPSFHRDQRLMKIEEETCEFELDYIRLLAANDPTQEVRAAARAKYAQAHERAAAKSSAVLPFLAGVPAPKEIPLSERDAMYFETAEKFSPFADLIHPGEVQAGDPRVGTPWISPQIREQVLVSQGVRKQAPIPSAAGVGPDGRPLPEGSPRP